jgi:hypothetical protein
MKKILLSRSSSLPNKTGAYVYVVTEPEANLAGIDGIYTSDSGAKLLYSSLRLGTKDVPFRADCRVTVSKKNGLHYISLIDPAAEQIGALGATAKMFAQAGLDMTAFSTVAAQSVISKMKGFESVSQASSVENTENVVDPIKTA